MHSCWQNVKCFEEWEMFAYSLKEYLQLVCNCTPKGLRIVQFLYKGATYSHNKDAVALYVGFHIVSMLQMCPILCGAASECVVVIV